MDASRTIGLPFEATREDVVIHGKCESHHENRPEDGYCMSEFTEDAFERRVEGPVAVKPEAAQTAPGKG